ncbi:MAG: SDR family oxidoreductase [Candidatus Dadabacteria bacterium]|nr:SDR family oxidoreductase [Candidatus Dadabacteria bacterium]NIS07660.1 SDR family oxidoreductase [Candidatus Dadabacteria bacterium]NIV42207.1 SDR family NAD(P)-dependent oxidoreductase [Candidatus Dadabacteria bacterium]NIY21296.1 SDR family NAD(P)-dependent oxidoreductase [Candidatus Dadabacteria bacterium]
MNKISILGCGWLGLPLAKFLIEQGFEVKGSTATRDKLSDLKSKGIEQYYVNLSPEINPDFDPEFFNTDMLIINFPPQRRENIVSYHQNQIRSLVGQIKNSPIEYMLFVSSTSVYPDLNREVKESETEKPTKESGKALIKVENILMNLENVETTVLRLAGLIGYDRMPGRFLSGKRGIKNGNAPVNLIHRDDCIFIIHQIISQGVWGEVLNGCSDEHPLRKDYYTHQAKLIGADPPDFDDSDVPNYKIISNKKLKKILDYDFKYPDPSKIEDI